MTKNDNSIKKIFYIILGKTYYRKNNGKNRFYVLLVFSDLLLFFVMSSLWNVGKQNKSIIS